MVSSSTQTVEVVPEPEDQRIETTAEPRPLPELATKRFTIKIQGQVPS